MIRGGYVCVRMYVFPLRRESGGYGYGGDAVLPRAPACAMWEPICHPSSTVFRNKRRRFFFLCLSFSSFFDFVFAESYPPSSPSPSLSTTTTLPYHHHHGWKDHSQSHSWVCNPFHQHRGLLWRRGNSLGPTPVTAFDLLER